MDHQLPGGGSEVFVGGLSRSIDEDTINEEFSTCGDILEVRLIKDHTGKSKGFGFVRFATKEAADKALKEKSGITLDGKKIGVLPSNEQKSLYFGKICKDWTDDEFEEILRQDFPDVVSVELPKPFTIGEASQKQQNRGFALVKFSSHAAAVKAYRVGTKPDFSIAAGSCHPVVKWAEDTNVDPEELAKVKTAFVSNLPQDADEKYLRELFEPLGKLDRVTLSNKRDFPVGYIQFLERSVSFYSTLLSSSPAYVIVSSIYLYTDNENTTTCTIFDISVFSVQLIVQDSF
ncbi:heterogeneous nuclear ribonucleoprotein Q-like [Impatiens glandulifera]|uniref:heterogeneous nuclear ribonucleoprotein Q-like n=1 Tax=Impatiens glandulifera TaxID=253017 RepID=UPI001FB08883|nr:heterogeneous nuclear ribonucleoprotein Q-like [Impatiens glandulifera]